MHYFIIMLSSSEQAIMQSIWSPSLGEALHSVGHFLMLSSSFKQTGQVLLVASGGIY